MVSREEIRKLEKEIVHEYTVPKDVKLSGSLASDSAMAGFASMPVLHTPQRTVRQDPSEVLFSAEKSTGPRDGEMAKLLAIRTSLEEELRARNLRLMKEADRKSVV